MKRLGNTPVWVFIIIGVILFVYGMGSLGVAQKQKQEACNAKGGVVVAGQCVSRA